MFRCHVALLLFLLPRSCPKQQARENNSASTVAMEKKASKDQSFPTSLEFQVSLGPSNDGLIFSVGDPMPSDEDAHEISDTPLSGHSADHAFGPGAPSLMKSRSLPNIRASTISSGEYAFELASSMSRSFDDLHALGTRQKEVFIIESDDQIRGDQERDNNMVKTEFPDSIDPLVDANTLNGVTPAGEDLKVTPGTEAAERYISSLSANATAAQLANHGLLVIPIFSAFVSLKVLNLSGNAIVRITAGALPRGLHILNLSKNNISTVRGLHELTRLRVLDLSYNRILRIGHGLASCSSLKELYLAGNKISEVEGLHRLLKLSVLDLRFNQISSTKYLGQLAANYNSLQAISLEGNPSQNVGDEQMKKYLQVLLPHLVSYNGQPIKVRTLQDAADQPIQLGMNSHQFDHRLRLDHETIRKGGHGVVAARRPSTTSTHAHRIQTMDSSKLSKHDHLPPTTTKVSTQSRYHSRRFFWYPIFS